MSCITMLPLCRSADEGYGRVFNELPAGLINCKNLEFSTVQNFVLGSLIVRIDGITLDPTQYVEDIENNTFTLIVDPDDRKHLNSPPSFGEVVRVDYNSVLLSSQDSITFL